MTSDIEPSLIEMHASDVMNPEKWGPENNTAKCDRVLIVLLYGSWNLRISKCIIQLPMLVSLMNGRNNNVMKALAIASVKVDTDDVSYECCVNELSAPPELPAIVFVGAPSSARDSAESNNCDENKLRVEHVSLSGSKLDALLTCNSGDNNLLVKDMEDTLSRLIDSDGKLKPPSQKQEVAKPTIRRIAEPAIRLFIAGDRSQVGKSSICMGILGALLKSGKYSPSDLAYIKPATQCEQTQLVQEFCKAKGITACVPIGPIVYYKGFTRAFLKGEVGETSEQLLYKAGCAVDELAAGKKVVIIDGVGYPSVGSITGTDNASVARSCGINRSSARAPVPVLLIGKSGVGDAVDSFNINATYFTHRDVPVIGAIFNKLSLEGFYSLDNCKEAIEMYFSKFQPDRTAFGFVPEIPSLMSARQDIANVSKDDQLKQALKTADAFVEEFRRHVNVEAILKAAKHATDAFIEGRADSTLGKRLAEKPVDELQPTKQMRFDNQTTGPSLTRAQIEAMASAQGAAGG